MVCQIMLNFHSAPTPSPRCGLTVNSHTVLCPPPPNHIHVHIYLSNIIQLLLGVQFWQQMFDTNAHNIIMIKLRVMNV